MDEALFDQYVKEIDEIYEYQWGSAEEFVKNGFGFCLLENDKFVSTCTTFNIDKTCNEVNVNTNEKYRRQGLALVTGSAFIEYSISKDLIPIWDAGK